MILPFAGANMPPPHGQFGAVRKYDRHTGLDLYCPEGTAVQAIAAGEVVDVGLFTGPRAESPWWLETQYCVIRSQDIFVLYGEIVAHRRVGERLSAGDKIGIVSRVLRRDKGLPTSMLHIEVYKTYNHPLTWALGTDCPAELVDPAELVFGSAPNKRDSTTK